MPTGFYNDIIEVVRKNADIADPSRIIDDNCRRIGKDPEHLQPKDGGLLVAMLMSDLGRHVSENEWSMLDDGFKSLLRNGEIRGKARGILLNHISGYLAIKWGRDGTSRVYGRASVPATYKVESWYPLGVLEDTLCAIDKEFPSPRGSPPSRSREVGRSISYGNGLRTMQYWFGEKQPCTPAALSNLGELVQLEHFKTFGDGFTFTVSFSDFGSERLTDFLAGLCDAVMRLRGVDVGSLEISRSDRVTRIRIDERRKVIA